MTFFQKNRIFITFILTDIYENDLSGKRIKKHSTQKKHSSKICTFQNYILLLHSQSRNNKPSDCKQNDAEIAQLVRAQDS